MNTAEQCSRYAQLAASEARRQFDLLKQATPAHAGRGEVPMTLAINIVEQMLSGQAPQADERIALRDELAALVHCLPTSPGDDTPRVVDLRGQHRRVYNPLLLDLTLKAIEHFGFQNDEKIRRSFELSFPTVDRPDMLLWRSKITIHYAGNVENLWYVTSHVVDAVLSQPGSEGSLHAMDADESLDAWTFNELTGLHALAAICVANRVYAADSQIDRWNSRMREIAIYHFENTQPDNVTTQPWGYPAFAMFSETQMHAEQQLHDIASNAASADRCDIVTALLLADACFTLHAAAARL